MTNVNAAVKLIMDYQEVEYGVVEEQNKIFSKVSTWHNVFPAFKPVEYAALVISYGRFTREGWKAVMIEHELPNLVDDLFPAH